MPPVSSARSRAGGDAHAIAAGDFTAGPLALFISDVHLQADAPETARVFFDFLQRHAPGVRQLYLLGDLFEYWAGDDDLTSSFNAHVVSVLRDISNAGVEIFWMAGNRDFLVGERFAAAAHLTLLEDPSIVTIAGHRLVLSHGDALCTDDTGYQAFRQQVRNPEWQAAFLAQPLGHRLALIGKMREGSRAAQREKSSAIMDVNEKAVEALFSEAGTDLMIHGHTHRPAVHEMQVGSRQCIRYVLSDWDMEQGAARGAAIAIQADGTIMVISAIPPASS